MLGRGKSGSAHIAITLGASHHRSAGSRSLWVLIGLATSRSASFQQALTLDDGHDRVTIMACLRPDFGQLISWVSSLQTTTTFLSRHTKGALSAPYHQSHQQIMGGGPAAFASPMTAHGRDPHLPTTPQSRDFAHQNPFTTPSENFPPTPCSTQGDIALLSGDGAQPVQNAPSICSHCQQNYHQEESERCAPRFANDLIPTLTRPADS